MDQAKEMYWNKVLETIVRIKVANDFDWALIYSIGVSPKEMIKPKEKIEVTVEEKYDF